MGRITTLSMAVIMTVGGVGVIVPSASAQVAPINIAASPPAPQTVAPMEANQSPANQTQPGQVKPNDAPPKAVTMDSGNRYQLMPDGTMRVEDFASAGSKNPTFSGPHQNLTGAARMTRTSARSSSAARPMGRNRTWNATRMAR